MGTWGADILENDTALDVYSKFEGLYYERKDLNEIKISVRQSSGLVDETSKPVLEDNTNGWLAYALICWECQTLDKETLEIVDQILEQQIDSENWEELWEKRKKVIERLRKKISVPSKKIKSIPKLFKLTPPFEVGDCVTFKFEDGMYGGAICTAIVTDHKKPEYHTWHFAYVKLHAHHKPVLTEFYESYFLIRKYAGSNPPYYTKLQDSMHYAFTGRITDVKGYERMKNEMASLEVIGRLKMKQQVTARGGNMCFDLARWNLEHLVAQETHAEEPNHDFPVKDFAIYDENVS